MWSVFKKKYTYIISQEYITVLTVDPIHIAKNLMLKSKEVVL